MSKKSILEETPTCREHGKEFVQRVKAFVARDNCSPAFWVADGWLCVKYQERYFQR